MSLHTKTFFSSFRLAIRSIFFLLRFIFHAAAYPFACLKVRYKRRVLEEEHDHKVAMGGSEKKGQSIAAKIPSLPPPLAAFATASENLKIGTPCRSSAASGVAFLNTIFRFHPFFFVFFSLLLLLSYVSILTY
jgi:hypothetical protein